MCIRSVTVQALILSLAQGRGVVRSVMVDAESSDSPAGAEVMKPAVGSSSHEGSLVVHVVKSSSVENMIYYNLTQL